MNRVFYVEELVKQIALNVGHEYRESASLLALACCCKALEDPVMDILWRRHVVLEHIILTLPADCWAMTDGICVSGHVSALQVTLPGHSLLPAFSV